MVLVKGAGELRPLLTTLLLLLPGPLDRPSAGLDPAGRWWVVGGESVGAGVGVGLRVCGWVRIRVGDCKGVSSNDPTSVGAIVGEPGGGEGNGREECNWYSFFGNSILHNRIAIVEVIADEERRDEFDVGLRRKFG